MLKSNFACEVIFKTMSKHSETLEKPISQPEMMAYLNLSRQSILNLRKKKLIPFIQIGAKIMYQPSKVIEALTKKADNNE